MDFKTDFTKFVNELEGILSFDINCDSHENFYITIKKKKET